MRARTQVLKDLSRELDTLGKAKVASKVELKAQLRDLGRIVHQVIYSGKVTKMGNIKTEYGKAKAEQYNSYFGV